MIPIKFNVNTNTNNVYKKGKLISFDIPIWSFTILCTVSYNDCFINILLFPIIGTPPAEPRMICDIITISTILITKYNPMFVNDTSQKGNNIVNNSLIINCSKGFLNGAILASSYHTFIYPPAHGQLPGTARRDATGTDGSYLAPSQSCLIWYRVFSITPTMATITNHAK